MQHERLKRTNLAPHTGKKSATKEVTNNMDETDTIPEVIKYLLCSEVFLVPNPE